MSIFLNPGDPIDHPAITGTSAKPNPVGEPHDYLARHVTITKSGSQSPAPSGQSSPSTDADSFDWTHVGTPQTASNTFKGNPTPTIQPQKPWTPSAPVQDATKHPVSLQADGDFESTGYLSPADRIGKAAAGAGQALAGIFTK